MMWRRLSAGLCLEGNAPIPLDVGPQMRILDRFRQDFDVAPEGLRIGAADRHFSATCGGLILLLF